MRLKVIKRFCLFSTLLVLGLLLNVPLCAPPPTGGRTEGLAQRFGETVEQKKARKLAEKRATEFRDAQKKADESLAKFRAEQELLIQKFNDELKVHNASVDEAYKFSLAAKDVVAREKAQEAFEKAEKTRFGFVATAYKAHQTRMKENVKEVSLTQSPMSDVVSGSNGFNVVVSRLSLMLIDGGEWAKKVQVQPGKQPATIEKLRESFETWPQGRVQPVVAVVGDFSELGKALHKYKLAQITNRGAKAQKDFAETEGRVFYDAFAREVMQSDRMEREQQEELERLYVELAVAKGKKAKQIRQELMVVQMAQDLAFREIVGEGLLRDADALSEQKRFFDLQMTSKAESAESIEQRARKVLTGFERIKVLKAMRLSLEAVTWRKLARILIGKENFDSQVKEAAEELGRLGVKNIGKLQFTFAKLRAEIKRLQKKVDETVKHTARAEIAGVRLEGHSARMSKAKKSLEMRVKTLSNSAGVKKYEALANRILGDFTKDLKDLTPTERQMRLLLSTEPGERFSLQNWDLATRDRNVLLLAALLQEKIKPAEVDKINPKEAFERVVGATVDDVERGEANSQWLDFRARQVQMENEARAYAVTFVERAYSPGGLFRRGVAWKVPRKVSEATEFFYVRMANNEFTIRSLETERIAEIVAEYETAIEKEQNKSQESEFKKLDELPKDLTALKSYRESLKSYLEALLLIGQFDPKIVDEMERIKKVLEEMKLAEVVSEVEKKKVQEYSRQQEAIAKELETVGKDRRSFAYLTLPLMRRDIKSVAMLDKLPSIDLPQDLAGLIARRRSLQNYRGRLLAAEQFDPKIVDEMKRIEEALEKMRLSTDEMDEIKRIQKAIEQAKDVSAELKEVDKDIAEFRDLSVLSLPMPQKSNVLDELPKDLTGLTAYRKSLQNYQSKLLATKQFDPEIVDKMERLEKALEGKKQAKDVSVELGKVKAALNMARSFLGLGMPTPQGDGRRRELKAAELQLKAVTANIKKAGGQTGRSSRR